MYRKARHIFLLIFAKRLGGSSILCTYTACQSVLTTIRRSTSVNFNKEAGGG